MPLVNSTRDKSCGELFLFVNHKPDGLQAALALAVQTAWRGFVQRRRIRPILYGVSVAQVRRSVICPLQWVHALR